MKINLEDNGKWVTEERRRQKRRGLVLAGAILLLAAVFAGIWAYRYRYVESGRYYPQIILEAAPAADEPVVYISGEFKKVVKSPSLPFTMLAAGDVISDGDEYCIFLYQDAYYVMAEVEAETSYVLRHHILPALGADMAGSTCFNRQEGYLNSRHVETECRTFTLGNSGNLYTISYRLLLPEGRDIVIVGISSGMDMESVRRNIEKIFYSIHEVTPQKVGKTQAIDFEVAGEGNPGSLIGNIVVHMDGGAGIPMDEEFFPGGTAQGEICPNPGGIHELGTGMLYKSGEEKSVMVEEDFDALAFVFSYGLPVELTSIQLVGPSGDVFYPDSQYKFIGYDYVFLVDAPMQGEWRFVWTAADRIGSYEGYYTKPRHYIPPAELVRQTDDRETE